MNLNSTRASGYGGSRQIDSTLSMHFVLGIGDVVVITFGGIPFGVVVPQKKGLGLIWADRPEIGPLEVLRALETKGPLTTPEICEHLRMRQRVVACHLRTLIKWGKVGKLERTYTDGSEYSRYEAILD